MSTSMNAEQKYELVTRNLAEVLGGDQMQAVLAERDLKCYWGTAPTGRPHLGYFVPLTKIADFLSAGVTVKVLLADVHAFLDNLKAPIALVEHRANYYRLLLTAVFRSLQLPLEKLHFVVGSSYQYTREYNTDKLRLCAITTEHDARKAGAEVVKEVESPLLSGLIYPLMQALDEQYLDVDFQFGGVDQRKIFTFAEANLPKLGYAKRSHLMNTMVPGLSGGKMSSSDPNSKIDFLDPPAAVKSKISKAVCAPGVVEGNGVLAFVRHVIVQIGSLMISQGRAKERAWVGKDADESVVFSIPADEKHGTPERSFRSVEELEQAYAKEEVHPADLKAAVTLAINALLAPIQEEFKTNVEFQQAEKDAYPPVEEVKKKKVKNYAPMPDWVKEKKQKEAAAKNDGTVPEVPTPAMDGLKLQ